MMTLTIIFGVLQSIFISLGVGSSTLAISNFFAAIADGTIDETERRMMGIVYVVLRIAMVGILIATSIVQLPVLLNEGVFALSPFYLAQWIVLLVLYTNAILMTMRLMPSTFGPGLQAGSWYTLGVLMALALQGITQYSLLQFMLGYAVMLSLGVGAVNGTMAYLKARKAE